MVFRLFGRGAGRGGGAGQGGQRGGRMGGSRAAGPGGYCVCPNCGYRVEHQRTKPCYQMQCPQCGTRLVRA